MTLYRKTTRQAADSVVNGNCHQALEQLQQRCRTKPIEFATRVALVVGVLSDPDDYNRISDAEKFVKFLNARCGQ